MVKSISNVEQRWFGSIEGSAVVLMKCEDEEAMGCGWVAVLIVQERLGVGKAARSGRKPTCGPKGH